MKKLKKTVDAKHRAAETKKPDGGTEPCIPVYKAGGKATETVKHRIPKKLAAFTSVLVLFVSSVYLPAFLYNAPPEENELALKTAIDAVKRTNDYTKNHPDDDFDGDGLLNYLELQHGTSPRQKDSDGDGVCDYAEIYLTDTNPVSYNGSLLERYVKAQLDEAGTPFDSPYESGGVILWADDLHSRAFGGTVRTFSGYRISGFHGWAEFPAGNYAYKKDASGQFTLLQRRGNAWRIEGDCEIVLYDDILTHENRFSFCGMDAVLSDQFFGRLLSYILPDVGYITCVRNALTPEESIKTVSLTVPDWDAEDDLRFGENHNSLKDLAEVYQMLDAGSAVLTSLNSAENGEAIALIYGYTQSGNLLVTDIETLQPAGVLQVIPRASVLLNRSGVLERTEWFDFYGLGFDSRRNDRIHFISASV